MVISMLKIRRPLGRLIFNMGIAIPGKTVFLIETAPWLGLKHFAIDPYRIFQSYEMLTSDYTKYKHISKMPF